MIEIAKHIILESAAIKDAIIKLNQLSDNTMTLIVVNDDSRAIGTVTDGDIRRAIAHGEELSSSLSNVVNNGFLYLDENRGEDIYKLKQAHIRGIKLLPRIGSDGSIQSLYNLQSILSLIPIDAVIMAGGKGERLRPLTDTTPKPLLPVGNKSIIDYNVERLIAYGVENIFVTVNYLAEQLETHFSGTLVQTVREKAFLGTMGAIRLVHDFQHDSILVMNSDLFTNLDFEKFYIDFKDKDADMSVAVVPYTVSIPLGIMTMNGHNVTGVVEKPTYNYYANAGIYLIKRDVLKFIPMNERFDATQLIQVLLDNKKCVIRFPITGYWIDIGTKQDYEKAQDLVKHLQ